MCLDAAERDVRALVRDYADLENMMADLGGRRERVSGTHEPGINLAVGAEALQRDIWHLLTTWEEIIREYCGLSRPYAGRVRDGWAVQQAVRLIAPRLEQAAKIGPWACYPRGFSHPPEDVTGAEAIQLMRKLHGRASAAIGLAHLVHSLRGPCWRCGIEGGLRRNDGSETVYCGLCQATLTWQDYDRSVRKLILAHKQ